MAASPESACDLAAIKAEKEWNIPPGILSAVGTVESGRAGRGGVAPWPWTINAAGRGSHHGSKGDAIATVLTIMAQGFPYIDVGCFQVDLAYHPGVFRSLDDAFDPDRNARAAAEILMRHRIDTGDWALAVARYHSATPERGSQYLRRVRNALPSATVRALNARTEFEAETPTPVQSTPIPSRQPKLPTVIYGLPVDQASPAKSRRQPAPTSRTIRLARNY